MNIENPLDRKDDNEATHVEPVAITIEAHGGEMEEVPDFLSMLGKKSLTKDEDYDTMDDEESDLEMKALKMLIDKYKREK